MKTYLIIERFHPGKVQELYRRFDKQGRLLPDGVSYINSWIDEELSSCYQIMESPHLELLWEWVDKWKDLADFEIIPVLSSSEVRQKVLGE